MSTINITHIPAWNPVWESRPLEPLTSRHIDFSGLPRTSTMITRDAVLDSVDSDWNLHFTKKKASIEALGSVYEFKEPDAVVEFLLDNDFLIGLLEEAYPNIAAHFGQSFSVNLELVYDPDSGGGPELFGLVSTTLRPEEAMKRLDMFDEEWWLEKSYQGRCKLNFDIR